MYVCVQTYIQIHLIIDIFVREKTCISRYFICKMISILCSCMCIDGQRIMELLGLNKISMHDHQKPFIYCCVIGVLLQLSKTFHYLRKVRHLARRIYQAHLHSRLQGLPICGIPYVGVFQVWCSTGFIQGRPLSVWIFPHLLSNYMNTFHLNNPFTESGRGITTISPCQRHR